MCTLLVGVLYSTNILRSTITAITAAISLSSTIAIAGQYHSQAVCPRVNWGISRRCHKRVISPKNHVLSNTPILRVISPKDAADNIIGSEKPQGVFCMNIDVFRPKIEHPNSGPVRVSWVKILYTVCPQTFHSKPSELYWFTGTIEKARTYTIHTIRSISNLKLSHIITPVRVGLSFETMYHCKHLFPAFRRSRRRHDSFLQWRRRNSSLGGRRMIIGIAPSC